MLSISEIPFDPFYIAVAVVGLFVVIHLIYSAQKMPYKRAPYLLTKSEHHFYKALKQAIPDNTHICMKVRMGDLLICSDREWKAGWGPKISAKHVDFVLINAHTTEIICAIELDDSTHRTNRNRIDRDKFVNKAFETAGVNLIRINTQRHYDVVELKETISVTV